MFNRRKLFAIFASAPAVVKAAQAAPVKVVEAATVKVVPKHVINVTCSSACTITLPEFRPEHSFTFTRYGW